MAYTMKTITCPHCGINKEIPAWRKAQKFCSHSCHLKHNRPNYKNPVNEANGNWKGDYVGYGGLHTWINKKYGKADHCSNDPTHKSTRYHWANISGKYLRDIKDFKQLCPSCHKLLDNKPSNYPHRKKVAAYNDNFGISFPSVNAAMKAYPTTAIMKCLKQRTKQAGGLKWKYIK